MAAGEVVFSARAGAAAEKESDVTLWASTVVAAVIAGSGGVTADGGAWMTTSGLICNDDDDDDECFSTKSISSQELSRSMAAGWLVPVCPERTYWRQKGVIW